MLCFVSKWKVAADAKLMVPNGMAFPECEPRGLDGPTTLTQNGWVL